MTVEELKVWSEKEYSEIKEMLKKISSTIYGNGSAGLCEDNRNNKQDIIDHELRVTKLEKTIKKKTIKEEAVKFVIQALITLIPMMWLIIQMSEKITKLSNSIGVH